MWKALQACKQSVVRTDADVRAACIARLSSVKSATGQAVGKRSGESIVDKFVGNDFAQL